MNTNKIKKEMASLGFYIISETRELIRFYKPSSNETREFRVGIDMIPS